MCLVIDCSVSVKETAELLSLGTAVRLVRLGMGPKALATADLHETAHRKVEDFLKPLPSQGEAGRCEKLVLDWNR